MNCNTTLRLSPGSHALSPARSQSPARLGTQSAASALDAPLEPSYDRLTSLATRLLRAPLAALALLDDGQLVIESLHDPQRLHDVHELPSTPSLCEHVARTRAPLVIDDLSAWPGAGGDPQGGRAIGAWIGVPVALPTGEVFGALCVADRAPRSWDVGDVAALRDIAAMAVTQLRFEAAKRGFEAERAACKALFDSPSVAIYALDAQGRVTHWSRAAAAHFGWSEDEALGRTPPFVPPEEERAFHALIQAALGSDDLRGVELRRRRRDGTAITVQVSTTKIRDSAGAVTGLVAIATDVSEQRRLEAKLQQAQKMEAIGRLAGGVAHDFNNLLTAILGYCELLIESLPAGDARDDVRVVKEAADRATSLTRQLLAFSRQQVLEPREVDLNAVMSDVARLLRRLIGEDIEVRLDPAAAPAVVRADPGQIEQVLMNLAVNARDAMPSGGHLTISTARVDGARAGLDPAARYVALRVRDTGVGMDAATRERIFEPFFTTKGPGRGTGLGLATVYGIVAQSGGAVHVESEPGRGATFTVYLPAVEGVAPRERLASERCARHGSERVLVVDDDAAVRALIARLLRARGFEVLEAEGADAAEEILERHPDGIDLLLTDLVMPRRYGWELAEAVRARRPWVPALYISGYAEQPEVARAITEDPRVFLAKPFSPEALVSRVRALLDEPLLLPA